MDPWRSSLVHSGSGGPLGSMAVPLDLPWIHGGFMSVLLDRVTLVSFQCTPAWWQSCLRRCFLELTLQQRSQLSVTGGSILAPVSNSKGGENLFSKPSRRYVGLSRGRQPETLVPRLSFMGHCESSGSRNGLSDSALPNGAWDPPT